MERVVFVIQYVLFPWMSAHKVATSCHPMPSIKNFLQNIFFCNCFRFHISCSTLFKDPPERLLFNSTKGHWIVHCQPLQGPRYGKSFSFFILPMILQRPSKSALATVTQPWLAELREELRHPDYPLYALYNLQRKSGTNGLRSKYLCLQVLLHCLPVGVCQEFSKAEPGRGWDFPADSSRWNVLS